MWMDNKKDAMTCFFLDTNVRKDKNTATLGNKMRFWIKIVLLLLSVYAHYWALGGNYGGFGSCGSASLACACIFIARIMLQMFVFWDRVTSWTEVFPFIDARICVSHL